MQSPTVAFSLSLNFGIDSILRSTKSSSHQHPAVTLPKSRELTGLPQVATFLPFMQDHRIAHLYGQDRQLNSNIRSHPWLMNAPNQNISSAYNLYSSSEPYFPHSIPSIVQRVPLAISFRTKSSEEAFADQCLPYQSANRPGKRKKTWTRAVFSSLQRKGLERSFVAQQYISKKDRRKLAATLGLTDSQVRIWYANRRMKQKKATKPEY